MNLSYATVHLTLLHRFELQMLASRFRRRTLVHQGGPHLKWSAARPFFARASAPAASDTRQGPVFPERAIKVRAALVRIFNECSSFAKRVDVSG